MPDGTRTLFKGIWAAQVPPKVRIFAWRLSQEGLATQYNRKQRKLTQHATCQVCGAGDETGYHAVVQCPKARALWQELRGSWMLPNEEQFRYSGADWLILLLNSVSKEVGMYILLMFWRAWFLRNDVMFGKGTASIIESANFLTAYAETLQVGKRGEPKEPDDKGKAKLNEGRLGHKASDDRTEGDPKQEDWKPPPQGWVKINTDAGYCVDSGEASAGVVIRDNKGMVLLAAWQMLKPCSSPEETEAEAYLLGIRLSAEWVRQPAIIETDCANIIRALRSKTEGRAAWEGILKEIRAACMLLPVVKFQYIRRTANKVAHTLAQHAMHTKEFGVKRLQTPRCISKLVGLEATSTRGPGPSRQEPLWEDPCILDAP
jgi:hypothetical protein